MTLYIYMKINLVTWSFPGLSSFFFLSDSVPYSFGYYASTDGLHLIAFQYPWLLVVNNLAACATPTGNSSGYQQVSWESGQTECMKWHFQIPGRLAACPSVSTFHMKFHHFRSVKMLYVAVQECRHAAKTPRWASWTLPLDSGAVTAISLMSTFSAFMKSFDSHSSKGLDQCPCNSSRTWCNTTEEDFPKVFKLNSILWLCMVCTAISPLHSV